MRQLSTTILFRMAVTDVIGYAGVVLIQTVEQLLWLHDCWPIRSRYRLLNGTALLCRSREPDKAPVAALSHKQPLLR